MRNISLGPVLSKTHDSTVVITLNRPEVRNAIDHAIRALLAELLNEAENDPDIKVIVITGTDPAFSGGVDLKSFNQPPPPGPHPASLIRSVKKPVIAATNGVCITGGLEIALSCDFIVSSDRATFADTHSKIGLVPARGMWGMSALLSEAVGIRRAKEMSITGRFINAEEALVFGLVNQVVPHEQLIPTVLRIANSIAEKPDGAAQAWLDIYDQGAGKPFEEKLAIEKTGKRLESN